MRAAGHSGMNTSAVNKWESQQMAQGLSLRTVDERSRVLRRLRAGTGADPVTVDSATLARWLAGQPWSQSTRATYDSYLRCWFGWLRDEGLRTDDPMPRRKPKAPRRQGRPGTDAPLRRSDGTRPTTAYTVRPTFRPVRQNCSSGLSKRFRIM